MAERMLQFVRLSQQTPDKRDAAERRADFGEIYHRFSAERASEQASRCSQCGVPFCSVHCPLNQNIPDWLKLTAEGRLQEAHEVNAATNTFPEICGRVCPQDRLCEGNCVIEKGFESVTIGAVERYINDVAWEKGWVKPPKPARELAHSVGIIGAGPAGLSAAEQLRLRGWQVTVYDRYDRVGGLMIYGIPNFKLEKEVVTRRAEQFAAGGINFVLNCRVGQDLNGVVPALDYLTASNREGLGDAVPEFASGALNAAGKKVVVIGGGDTAMDCVRTAIRQGAASVTCLYRRDKANMPGSMREVKNAEEEGVVFSWLSAPEGFLGENGAVTSVRAVKMHLGLPDATGRQQVEPIAGSEFTEPADLVIKALGFDPEDLPAMFEAPELAVSRWGTVQVDRRNMMTKLPGVFAAGDIVRGASLVVWGIRDGRDAADQIEKYVLAKAATPALAAE
jgi:glutamate synthase (NADPH/NADH) small chain